MENLLDTFKATFAGAGLMLFKVIGALLILLIGWIIAKFIRKIILKVLRRVGVDSLVEKIGIQDLVAKSGIKDFSLAKIFAVLIYLIIMLMVILSALNALDLTAVTALFNKIMMFIPKLIVVIILLLVGMYIANFVTGLIQKSTTIKESTKGLASKVSYYGILTITGFMALSQLGIAPEIVNTAFTLLLGSLCVGAGLAFGLAFGLGNKEKAGEAMDKFLDKVDVDKVDAPNTRPTNPPRV